MSQQEVIQALQNLGGEAFRDELIKEYYRIHYPSNLNIKRNTIKTKYDSFSDCTKYFSCLKRDRLIKTQKIFVGRKSKIKYSLTDCL